jgi:hypothetical protein
MDVDTMHSWRKPFYVNSYAYALCLLTDVSMTNRLAFSIPELNCSSLWLKECDASEHHQYYANNKEDNANVSSSGQLHLAILYRC